MKRIFLLITGILMLISGTVMATEKPNVIFIAVDDLNDWEGFMGNNQIITPNMDALASQGTFFRSAHCQYAVCGPSRASVMSGMYYHSLGFGVDTDLQQEDDAVYDAVKEKGSSLIYEYFADHGYKTMAAGKLLHHHVPEETVDVSHGRGGWDYTYDEDGNRVRLNWFGPGLLDWGPISKEEHEMSDYKAAEWAVDQLSQEHDKPFFLMTGFLRPHTPLYIQQKYLDMYPLDEIELPPYKADDYDDIPKAAESVWNTYPSTSWAIENNQWRKMLQAYMGCITFTDAQIGKILDALENSPYKDNTIVVLWSDHGFHMGEKDRFQKHTAWDRSTKVPMIIMDPRIGSTQGPTDPVEANVELIDIYPTLLELCGLPENNLVDGRSLVPLIENPDLEWGHPAYTFRREKYATVKYDTYRFIEYFDGSRELYNHANDPNEWDNLVGDDAYKAIIEEMYGLLQEPDVVLGYEESKNILEEIDETPIVSDRIELGFDNADSDVPIDGWKGKYVMISENIEGPGNHGKYNGNAALKFVRGQFDKSGFLRTSLYENLDSISFWMYVYKPDASEEATLKIETITADVKRSELTTISSGHLSEDAWIEFKLDINTDEPVSLRFTPSLPYDGDTRFWIDDMALVFDNDVETLLNHAINLPELTIYPVPCHSTLFFKAHEGGQLSIYNITGKMVYSKNQVAASGKVDLSRLEGGFYFLEIQGEQTYTRQFFKTW